MLKNVTKEQPLRLLPLETSDQSDEKTSPDREGFKIAAANQKTMTLILILNILLNKRFKRIEPEALELIEGSLLTKYTNSHARQYTIQCHINYNFGYCELQTNAH